MAARKSYILFVLFLILFSCSKEKSYHLSGRTMGTTYSVKFYTLDFNKKVIHEKIDQELLEVNRQMSTYIDDSEISTFNKLGINEWFKISPYFFTVLKYALEIAKKTDGLFDPTIGPLVNLWGFGPDGKRKVPIQKEIIKAKKYVGYKKLILDLKNKKIKKKVLGLYLDLSASAKGFAVDVIAELLERNNIQNYMVEIGGELKIRGIKGNSGKPWRIAIESPDEKNGNPYQKVLSPKNISLATSGDYRNFFKEAGKKYSHTIDYQTGKPVINNLASVTILEESCLKADTLATALMVMGVERALSFSKKMGIASYLVYRKGPKDNFIGLESKKFESFLKKW